MQIDNVSILFYSKQWTAVEFEYNNDWNWNCYFAPNNVGKLSFFAVFGLLTICDFIRISIIQNIYNCKTRTGAIKISLSKWTVFSQNSHHHYFLDEKRYTETVLCLFCWNNNLFNKHSIQYWITLCGNTLSNYFNLSFRLKLELWFFVLAYD